MPTTRLSASNRVRLQQPEIPPGRCYLVVGPQVWGKAFTVAQAWENAGKPNQFIVYDAPPCVTLDEMGSISWFPALYFDPLTDTSQPYPTWAKDLTPIAYYVKELYRFPEDLK